MSTREPTDDEASPNQAKMQGIVEAPIEGLHPCDEHLRGFTPVERAFVRSVEYGGIVQPPLVHPSDDGFAIIDGCRRVQAAGQAGKQTTEVVVYDVTCAEALELCIELNTGLWDKTVHESDEQQAVDRLADATDSDEGRLAYEMGLVSGRDRIARAVAHVDGVGPRTVDALATRFEDIQDLRGVSAATLEDIHGIGPKTAETLHRWLAADGPVLITHD